MPELHWNSDTISSPTADYQISNILSISFELRFDRNSLVCFSIKKPKSHTDLLTIFLIFLGKLSLICFTTVLIAQFSVLIALLFGLILLKLLVPYYWGVYCECHKKGVLRFEFADVVEFVTFQKQVWENERGKRLIRHGFVLGEAAEELFYVIFPAVIYNSDRLRHYLRFFNQVIYPIVIIIIPLMLTFFSLLVKNSKSLYKVLKKDKFVKLILFIADESADFIEDTANDYKLTRKIWRFFEKAFDYLEDLIEIASKWLRMEFLLIFMQIEYFNHCYISVTRTFLKTTKFWLGFFKRHGFAWLIKPLEKGVTRITKAVDINSLKDLNETGEKLVSEIDGVKKKKIN